MNQIHQRSLVRFAAGAAFALIVSVFIAPRVSAQFTFNETFSHGTFDQAGWEVGKTSGSFTPVLTASSAGGNIDTSGNGWLRMTNNVAQESTYARLTTPIPSANNTISVDLQFKMWTPNTSGADGFTISLRDASVPNFDVGAFGGSLGYAQKNAAAPGGADTTHAGMTGGYFSVGVDAFGNFSAATEGRQGGIGTEPNAIAVRGPGSGDGTNYNGGTNNNYGYVNGTTSLNQYPNNLGALNFTNTNTRPTTTSSAREILFSFDANSILTVQLKFGTNNWVQVFTADLSTLGPRPENLELVFTAGTGQAMQYIELKGLAIATTTAPVGTVYYSNYIGDNLWGNGANWGNATNPSLGAIPANTASLVFANHQFTAPNFRLTTAQNVQLGANRTAASIQFDAPFDYTLQGYTLTLDNTAAGADSAITVTSAAPGGAHSIQSALALNSDLNINLNTNTALNLAGNVSASAHTITLNNNGTTTFGGQINGSGTMTQLAGSTGTTVITGNSAATFTGNLDIQGGTLRLGNDNVLRAGTVLSLSSGTSTGSFDLANHNQTLGSLSFAGGGAVTTGTGTLTLGGNVTTTVATQAPGRVATIDGNLNLGTASRTFTVAAGTGPADLAIGANISGTNVGITKAGGGVLRLSGNNTFTGANNVTGGTLVAASNSALGTNTSSFSSGTTLGLEGGIDLNSGAITVRGTGVTGSNGAIDNRANNNTLSSAVALGAASTVGAAADSTLTIKGAVSGNYALTAGGAGTVILSGANTYGGATTVNAGATLIAASAGALGNVTGTATTTTVNAGGTLGFQGGIALTNENVTINGAGVNNGGALLNVSGNNSIANQVTLGSSSTVAAAAGSTLTLNGGITDGTATYNLTKSDAGTVVIANTANYGGTTTINGGTLSFGGAGTLSSTANITVNAGTLKLDNSVTNNTNRIAGAAISLNDGQISFVGNGLVNSTESLGAITASSGANTIYLQAGAGRQADLTIANLIPNGSATITFATDPSVLLGAGTTLNGTAGSPRVFLTQVNGATPGGSLTNAAALPGWIIVNDASGSANFAEYTGGAGFGNGVRALSSYYSGGLGVNVNDPNVSVLLNSSSPSAAYTLNRGARNSRTTDGNLKLTDASQVLLTENRILELTNGGLIKSGATASTISGTGTLTAATNRTLAITVDNAAGSLEISSNIVNTGTTAVTKAGAGLLTLSGTNTFSGNVNINDGVLSIDDESGLGSTTATKTIGLNGGTLRLTGTGVLTANAAKTWAIGAGYTGTFDIADSRTLAIANTGDITTGTGSQLVKTGAGVLQISASNAGFNGSALVNAGTLELTNANALGTNRTIGLNGGTLSLKSDAVTTFANNLAVTADSTVRVDRVSTTTGANRTLTLGTLAIGSNKLTVDGGHGYDLAIGAVTLNGNATFETPTFTGPTNNTSLTVGAISGSGSLTKTGASNMYLSAASTYAGATTVNGGTLFTQGTNRLPTGTALTIGSAGTVDTGNGSQTIASLAGAGTLTMGTGALTVGDNTSTIYSGTIASGAVTKVGTGTLRLSGTAANTITGNFNLTEGTVVAGKTPGLNTLGTGSLLLGDRVGGSGSAVLQLDAAEQINNASAVVIASDGRLDLNGNNETIGSLSGSGAITLGSGTLTTGGNADSTSYLGAISGTGGLTKLSSSTLTLSGNNSYTGGTDIRAGTIRAASNTALGTGTAGVNVANGAALELQNSINVTSPGRLTLNGTGMGNQGAVLNVSGDNTWNSNVALGSNTTINTPVGTLTFAGAVDLGSSTLTVKGDANTRVNGAITGTGGLIKDGDGILTLAGSGSTYSGTTTVSNGVLRIGAANAGPSSSTVTLAQYTTLDVNNYSAAVGSLASTDAATAVTLGSGSLSIGGNGASTTFAGVISGTGSIAKAGTGAFTLTGNNTYTGGTSIDAGTLVASTSANLGTGGITLAGGATLQLRNAANTTFAQSLSVTGNGTANLIVDRSSGTANVTETMGALTLGSTSGVQQLNVSKTAATGNFGATFGNTTLAGNAEINVAANTTLTLGATNGAYEITKTASAGALTFNGSINIGSLTLLGGDLYLNGANVNVGTLTLGGGTLHLGDTTANVGTFIITGNTTLDFGSLGAGLSTANFDIRNGAVLTITNWSNGIDYFYAQNWQGANLGDRGDAMETHVVWTTPDHPGSDTAWLPWNHEITPVPEPQTYGLIFLGACAGFLGWRRWRSRQRAA